MSQESLTPPTAPTQVVETSIHCLQCGHNLQGQRLDSVCPDCGTHVTDSYRGTLLKNSDPEYLETLHKGVIIIQASVIAAFTAGAASFIAKAVDLPVTIIHVLGFLGVAAYTGMVYGWWKLSEWDPQYQGRNAGDDVRLYVRIALCAVVATRLLQWVVTSFVATNAWTSSASTTDNLLSGGVDLLDALASVAMFVASMMYVKWISARIPNRRIVDLADKLMWVGPLFLTVGLFLFRLGPLAALILYWLALDWVRKDLKAIRGV